MFKIFDKYSQYLRLQHAADILENGDGSSSFMRPFWRWRPDAPRKNGLEEGPGGPRDIGHV